MRYQELQAGFGERLLFSLDDIRQVEPGFDKSRLYEWIKKGYIKRLLRRYYYFSGVNLDEQKLFMLANAVYRPSYISLESALSYYDIIPEKSLSITSVTTRKTAAFATPAGRFAYRKVLPSYYFGYGIKTMNAMSFLIASPEKALLDYFYFINAGGIDDAIESLRLNRKVLRELIDPQKISAMAKVFKRDAPGIGAGIIRRML